MDMSVRSGLADIPLFARLAEKRADALERHVTIRHFEAGERIYEEGAPNPGRLYVVIRGEAHTMADYEIAVRGRSERSPRCWRASVRPRRGLSQRRSGAAPGS